MVVVVVEVVNVFRCEGCVMVVCKVVLYGVVVIV